MKPSILMVAACLVSGCFVDETGYVDGEQPEPTVVEDPPRVDTAVVTPPDESARQSVDLSRIVIAGEDPLSERGSEVHLIGLSGAVPEGVSLELMIGAEDPATAELRSIRVTDTGFVAFVRVVRGQEIAFVVDGEAVGSVVLSELAGVFEPEIEDVAGMGAFSLSQEADAAQPGLYPVGVDALSFLAPPYLVYNENSGFRLVVEEGDVDVWFPAATGDRVCVVMLDQRVASSRAQCAVVP
jgi:hypothetical protein